MAEVCRRAGRIARVLAEHGVGPETPVGLCQQRGIGLLSVAARGVVGRRCLRPAGPGLPAGPAVRDGPRAPGCRWCSATRRTAGAGRFAGRRRPADPGGRSGGWPRSSRCRRCRCRPARWRIRSSPPAPPASPRGSASSTGRWPTCSARSSGCWASGPDDRFVAVTTLSFDIALLELLLPPLCGADLVIATAAETREPDRLRALIERTAATAMQATPQTWRLLLAAGGVPAGLRLRLCGGEALPRGPGRPAGLAPDVGAVEPVRADRDHGLVGGRDGRTGAAARCRSGRRSSTPGSTCWTSG